MQEVRDLHYEVKVTVQLHPADWFSESASGVFLLMEEKKWDANIGQTTTAKKKKHTHI